MPLPKGTPIGEYEVVRPIGSGAMGEVYEGVHSVIGKRVAIKVMRAPASEAVIEAKRLWEEAKVVNAIRHPGIVDIFGANVLPNGRAYLVMELLEGESLQEYLRTNLPLAIADIVWLLQGLLEPLAAAHKAGIIHRDLKPTNVFVSIGPMGRKVKLLDFGVAHRADRERFTSPEVTVGSLGFMSPDQLGGKVVPQSDVYAVGCVAWLLLTGKPVFPYGNMGDLALNHMRTVPPSVRTLRADTPEALARWVAKLLEKDAAKRPDNAFEALLALQLAMDDEGISTVVDRGELGDDDDDDEATLAMPPPSSTRRVVPLFDQDDEGTVAVRPPVSRPPVPEEEEDDDDESTVVAPKDSKR